MCLNMVELIPSLKIFLCFEIVLFLIATSVVESNVCGLKSQPKRSEVSNSDQRSSADSFLSRLKTASASEIIAPPHIFGVVRERKGEMQMAS